MRLLLCLLLLALVWPALEPIERAIPFATLSPDHAARLAGPERWYKVELDSSEDSQDAWILFDCKGDDEAVLYTIWLPEGSVVADEMLVRGSLVVIKHPASGDFAGFTEYRLRCESR
jgi:hypothetical protein